MAVSQIACSFVVFSTDEDFQMRGYGSQTLKLLPDFIREHLPMYKSIILGVNERNQVASYLYRETGFSKQSQRILGSVGWQEVYELKYKGIPSLKRAGDLIGLILK